MRTCARSCSTQTDSPASRTCPRRPTRCACSPAGSAARTWRRSASRRQGTVLGHEVVAQRADGARIALIHHLPCGECERCRAGHESTCERFAAPTIVPGGFAEEVEATEGIELPDAIGDAVGTYLEPLACVLRGAERVPRGRVLVVGQGFVGRLFAAVLRGARRRGLRHRHSDRSARAGAGRPRRRRRPLRPGGAARRGRAGRHRPRLLPRRARRPRPRLPERADADRLALGDAAAHAGGAGAPARARPARAAACSRSNASRTGSSSTAPAARSRSSSRREGAALPRPGRPAAGRRAEPGARAGRRARPGRGRAHRRHRPEDVPPRPSRPAAASCRARSGTSSAGSTSRPAGASSPPTRPRATSAARRSSS